MFLHISDRDHYALCDLQASNPVAGDFAEHVTVCNVMATGLITGICCGSFPPLGLWTGNIAYLAFSETADHTVIAELSGAVCAQPLRARYEVRK